MWQAVVRLLRWTAGQELAVLMGLLLISAGTWGFVELAGEVVEGDTDAFDHWGRRDGVYSPFEKKRSISTAR